MRIIPRRSARPRCARRSPDGSFAVTAGSARSGDAGAARTRQPRGPVRIRANGDRRQPSRVRRWSCRIRSIRSTKARRCSPARNRIASTPIRRPGSRMTWRAVPGGVWARTQLLYVCSPDNPTGRVLDLAGWRELFALSDRYGFVDRRRRVLFGNLFRRSAVRRSARSPPRTRSDATAFRGWSSSAACRSAPTRPACAPAMSPATPRYIKAFLLYRTYHGSAMSGAVAAASIAAWNDEAHVRANRAEYAAKFAQLQPQVASVLPCAMPEAAFYLWARTPIDDACSRGVCCRGERDRAAGQFRRARRERHQPGSDASGSRWSPRRTSARRPSSASSRSRGA